MVKEILLIRTTLARSYDFLRRIQRLWIYDFSAKLNQAYVWTRLWITVDGQANHNVTHSH